MLEADQRHPVFPGRKARKNEIAINESASLVWCVDSPSFGGSEIALMRTLQMVGSDNAAVVHGEEVCAELRTFLEGQCVITRSSRTGNSLKSSVQGLRQAFALLQNFPQAAFIIWAHHADSNRWLQLALALSGRRYVLAERSIPSDSSTFKNSRLSVPIKRIVAARAFRVVLNARSQVEHYRQLFRLRSASLIHISNTRPIASLQERVTKLREDKAGLRIALGLPSAPLVLCIGRLASYKGQADLIRALSIVARNGENCPTLVLVGDGPDRSDLENLARDTAPGRVIFAGHQTDPLPWMAAAHVFVQPSMLEGLSGALIEAMASRLPCIATAILGNAELVRDGETGMLVPVGDPVAIAQAIKKMISEPDFASGCAQSAYELVAREFDESTEREAWLILIRELTGNIQNKVSWNN